MSTLLSEAGGESGMQDYPCCGHEAVNGQNRMMQFFLNLMMVALLVDMMGRQGGGRFSGNGYNGNPDVLGRTGGYPAGAGCQPMGESEGPGACNSGREYSPGNGRNDLPGGDAGFERALRKTLKYEGGLSNDPDDRGGLTNKGITQGEFSSWLRKNGRSPRSVATITNEEMKQIYYQDYWKASGADQLPGNLGMAVFDTAVNMGVGTAKKMLRESGGDINRFLQLREQRYYRIASHGNNRKFLHGWLNRLNDLRQAVA
jgi:hypothetical protein